jgi:hypothetical protein
MPISCPVFVQPPARTGPIFADLQRKSRTRQNGPNTKKFLNLMGKCWRRGPGSNRRIKVLQTSPLPLGYRALAGLSEYVRIVPIHRSQPGWCRRAEWSGRRDLNSRPSPWQGDALPLSYSRLLQD